MILPACYPHQPQKNPFLPPSVTNRTPDLFRGVASGKSRPLPQGAPQTRTPRRQGRRGRGRTLAESRAAGRARACLFPHDHPQSAQRPAAPPQSEPPPPPSPPPSPQGPKPAAGCLTARPGLPARPKPATKDHRAASYLHGTLSAPARRSRPHREAPAAAAIPRASSSSSMTAGPRHPKPALRPGHGTASWARPGPIIKGRGRPPATRRRAGGGTTPPLKGGSEGGSWALGGARRSARAGAAQPRGAKEGYASSIDKFGVKRPIFAAQRMLWL